MRQRRIEKSPRQVLRPEIEGAMKALSSKSAWFAEMGHHSPFLPLPSSTSRKKPPVPSAQGVNAKTERGGEGLAEDCGGVDVVGGLKELETDGLDDVRLA